MTQLGKKYIDLLKIVVWEQERNFHFPAPGRKCITHRQAPAATACKITRTTLQPYLLLIIFVVCRYGSVVFLCTNRM
jgi:hypothetical protein